MPLQNFSLPIELTAFTGKIEGAINRLSWTTATEQNTKWHLIERSENGTTDFTEIARVAAAGNATTPRNYEAKDLTPLAKSYYRLRTIDLDGTSQVSPTILLARKKGGLGAVAAYPSPTTGDVTVSYEVENAGTLSWSVVDELGRTLSTQRISTTIGINTIKVNLSHLSAAVYFIVLEDTTSNRQVVRVVKQ